MAGFDLNRDPATVETDQHRSGSAKRAAVGSRAGGHRRRESTAAITATPKRTNALWFFVAFLGGGAGVWWTKSAFPDNAWIAAMVAAGVVLALIVYYMLNDEDAPEEEGDNVYYLGLLFTLVSLMFTLVELFGSDTDAVRNAEKVRVLLENFGIALTSTVVGIAGRVAVQNWQSAPPAEGSEFADDSAGPDAPAWARKLPGSREIQPTPAREDRAGTHPRRKRARAVSQDRPQPRQRHRNLSAQSE